MAHIILVWTGKGYLVPVFTFSSCLLMELTTRAVFQNNTYYQDHLWPMPTAIAIAALCCFGLGRFVRRHGNRTVMDYKTGKEHIVPPERHSFFGIEISYWAAILFILSWIAMLRQAVLGKI